MLFITFVPRCSSGVGLAVNLEAVVFRIARRHFQVIELEVGHSWLSPENQNNRRPRLCYMLLRYCPPTSNNASVIWPSEQERTAFTSSANTLPLSITVCFSFSSAAGASAALRFWNSRSRRIWLRFSSSVE